MTDTRLQRYALFLAGHDYNIEYKSTTDHGNADALLRLPLEIIQPSAEEDIDAVDVFHMSQIELLPVTSDEIRRETQHHMELSRMCLSLRVGLQKRNRFNLTTTGRMNCQPIVADVVGHTRNCTPTRRRLGINAEWMYLLQNPWT